MSAEVEAAHLANPTPAWLTTALAAGLTMEEQYLYELMVVTLNFTHAQYVCLKEMGGYSEMADLNQWKYKEISSWCHNMGRLSAARGGRTFGDLKVRQLQAIAWYVTDTLLRGQVIDVDEFKLDPDEYRQRAAFDYDNSQTTVTLDKPAKFEYKNWISWEDSVYRYFDSVYNVRGLPLSYVIRKDLAAGTQISTLDRHDQLVHTAAIEGFFFDMDNRVVLDVIKECVLDTAAETWIKNLKCGRTAMKALQSHYDGSAEGEGRIVIAKQTLEKLFYRHEFTFSFEKYVTALNGIFKTLERYNEPMYESDKVKSLLDKCQNNNTEFKQSVQMCRTLHTQFEDAVTFLKKEVGRIFPDVKGTGRKRNISNVNKGKGGKSNMVNGVDISDLSRWYQDEEFKKLPQWAQKKIATHPTHMKSNEGKRKKKKEARDSRSAAAVTTDGATGGGVSEVQDHQNRLVASIINGMSNATRTRIQTSAPVVQFPSNGSRAVSSARRSAHSNSTPDDSSQVTFDHLGNPV